MSTATAIKSFDTIYSADSTEFCPIKEYTHLLAVGTYQLTDEQQDKVRIRKGKTYLFDVNQSLIPTQVIETPAVLDMKWSHNFIDNQPTLSIVDSIGGLHLYGIKDNQLHLIERSQITEDDSVLCLSLDWANRINKSDNRMVTSHSNGYIAIISPNEGHYSVESEWKGHDLEAWIAAFDYWNTNVVYSGGDDAAFKGWDSRSNASIFTYRRHMMGVTTMQSSPHQEHVLATGSYDETIYFWDTRSMRAPVNTYQTPGGGIWRLKWHPTLPNRLLSASMHAGAFVIDVDAEFNAELSTSFLDHTSMVYGADWSYQNTNLIASCSFYDHVLHLWEAGN